MYPGNPFDRDRDGGGFGEFHHNHAGFNSTVKKGTLAVGCFFLIQLAVGIVLSVGVIYVAVHFIGKYW